MPVSELHVNENMHAAKARSENKKKTHTNGLQNVLFGIPTRSKKHLSELHILNLFSFELIY